MSGRGARAPIARPMSRILYVWIGFVFGAIIATVIQNITDAHLVAPYENPGAQSQGSCIGEDGKAVAARTCGLPAACGTIDYGSEDSITASSAKPPGSLWAWHFKDLRIELLPNGTAKSFTVSDNCYKALDFGGAPFPPVNVTSSLLTQLAHSPEKKLRKSCKIVEDNVLIISDTLGRAVKNIYDELSTVWYHFWLLKLATCRGGSRGGRGGGSWKVTHLNDILNDQPPRYPRRWEVMARASDQGVAFPNVLGVLGNYVPWNDLVKNSGGKCLKFKRAATLPSAWLWLDKPLPAANSHPLQTFIDAVLEELGLGGPRTGRCDHTVLYASRATSAARRVINEEALLATIREALPDFTIQNVDLGSLSFEDQVKAVRSADIFVFPHGGAGPHVVWLPYGAVVLELFPYADADPMYRNLAVQTGKTYLSWQASKFSAPFDWKKIGPKRSRDVYHFTNASDFEVDLAEIKPLISAAGATVRNTVGTNWFPSGGAGAGRPYSAFLCTICADKGRNHTCTTST